MGFENWLSVWMPALAAIWHSLNRPLESVEDGRADGTLGIASYLFTAVIHLPKAFAKHIPTSKVLVLATRYPRPGDGIALTSSF